MSGDSCYRHEEAVSAARRLYEQSGSASRRDKLSAARRALNECRARQAAAAQLQARYAAEYLALPRGISRAAFRQWLAGFAAAGVTLSPPSSLPGMVPDPAAPNAAMIFDEGTIADDLLLHAAAEPRARWMLFESHARYPSHAHYAWLPVFLAIIESPDPAVTMPEREEAHGYAARTIDLYAAMEQQHARTARRKKMFNTVVALTAVAVGGAVFGKAAMATLQKAISAVRAVKAAEDRLDRARAASVPSTAGEQAEQTVTEQERNMEKFSQWLQAWKPELHAEVMRRMPSPGASAPMGALDYDTGEFELGGIGELAGWWDDFMETTQSVVDQVVKVGSSILPTLYEKKILDIQLDRAKQGLPPLPQPQVEQMAASSSGVTGAGFTGFMSQGALMIAAGVGAGLLLHMFTGGGRRRR